MARHTPDPELLLDEALAAYAAASEPRNDLALMSIVGTIGETNRSHRGAVLDRIAADPRLIEALPAASVWPAVETPDVERLIRAYKGATLSKSPRNNLLMGRPFVNVVNLVLSDASYGDNHRAALRITALKVLLLERFGEREGASRSLAANLNTFASVGPLASSYTACIALVDGIPTFDKSQVGAWQEQLREDSANSAAAHSRMMKRCMAASSSYTAGSRSTAAVIGPCVAQPAALFACGGST